VSFSAARATTANGRIGSISSGPWSRTRINLAPSGRAYVAFGAVGEAKPSPLSAGGSSFQVGYSRAAPAVAVRFFGPRAR
jgi:hypothetical protein